MSDKEAYNLNTESTETHYDDVSDFVDYTTIHDKVESVTANSDKDLFQNKADISWTENSFLNIELTGIINDAVQSVTGKSKFNEGNFLKEIMIKNPGIGTIWQKELERDISQYIYSFGLDKIINNDPKIKIGINTIKTNGIVQKIIENKCKELYHINYERDKPEVRKRYQITRNTMATLHSFGISNAVTDEMDIMLSKDIGLKSGTVLDGDTIQKMTNFQEVARQLFTLKVLIQSMDGLPYHDNENFKKIKQTFWDILNGYTYNAHGFKTDYIQTQKFVMERTQILLSEITKDLDQEASEEGIGNIALSLLPGYDTYQAYKSLDANDPLTKRKLGLAIAKDIAGLMPFGKMLVVGGKALKIIKTSGVVMKRLDLVKATNAFQTAGKINKYVSLTTKIGEKFYLPFKVHDTELKEAEITMLQLQAGNTNLLFDIMKQGQIHTVLTVLCLGGGSILEILGDRKGGIKRLSNKIFSKILSMQSKIPLAIAEDQIPVLKNKLADFLSGVPQSYIRQIIKN